MGKAHHLFDKYKNKSDLYKLKGDVATKDKMLSGDAANEFMKQIVKK